MKSINECPHFGTVDKSEVRPMFTGSNCACEAHHYMVRSDNPFLPMYINKEQLELRLKGQSDLTVSKSDRGRKEGSKNLEHEERVLIGVLSKTDSQKNIAKEFGVSETTVSNISRGLDASRRVDEDLTKDIKDKSALTKANISDKALNTLMKSIGVIDTKLSSTKTAGEASLVAKNMAIIADKFSPSGPTGNSPRILININGPKVKQEEDYDVVEVNTL